MPASYLYHKDPKTSNRILFQLLVSLFIATGLTLLLLKVFKKKEWTAVELAHWYCDCVKAHSPLKGQEKYIKCDKDLEGKNFLFKLYMEKINSDPLITYTPDKQRQIDEFMVDFRRELNKSCQQ